MAAQKKSSASVKPEAVKPGEIETGLTVKSLEESGIKTSLNQNDLIEIVVEDFMEKLKQEVDFLNGKIADSFAQWELLRSQHAEKMLKELIKAKFIPADTGLDSISYSTAHLNPQQNSNSLSVYKISLYEGSNTEVYKIDRNHYIGSIQGSAFKLTVVCTIDQTNDVSSSSISGIASTIRKIDKFSREVIITQEMLDPIWEKAKKIGEEATAFVNKFPTGRINTAKMAREARAKMNKKILKNQAPALMKQMEKIFNLS